MGEAKRRAAEIIRKGYAGSIGPAAGDREMVRDVGECLADILAAIEPMMEQNVAAVLNALGTAHSNLLIEVYGLADAERHMRRYAQTFPELARQRARKSSQGNA